MPKHANAKNVLPEALLREVQKHYCGNLWIPEPNLYYEKRRKLVIELRSKGTIVSEIAVLAGLSPRRINQILAEARQNGELPST